jgi:hypothetical protein
MVFPLLSIVESAMVGTSNAHSVHWFQFNRPIVANTLGRGRKTARTVAFVWRTTQEMCRGVALGTPATLGVWANTQKALHAYCLPAHETIEGNKLC